MKETKNKISEWLKKYGNSETEKNVEYEIKHINSTEALKLKIKEYCKAHKLNLERYTNKGFIASRLVDIRAGMKYDLHSGKLISTPLKKIRRKRVFREFICYSDGDIIDNGITKNH